MSALTRFAYKRILRAAHAYAGVLDTRPVPLGEFVQRLVTFEDHDKFVFPSSLAAHVFAMTDVPMSTGARGSALKGALHMPSLSHSDPRAARLAHCFQSRLGSQLLTLLIRREFRTPLALSSAHAAASAALFFYRFLQREHTEATSILPTARCVSTTDTFPRRVSSAGPLSKTGDTSASLNVALPALPDHLRAVLAQSPHVHLPLAARPNGVGAPVAGDAIAPPVCVRLTLTAECDAKSVYRGTSNLRTALPVPATFEPAPLLSTPLPRAFFWVRLELENLGAAAVQLRAHAVRLVDQTRTTIDMWQNPGVMAEQFIDAAMNLDASQFTSPAAAEAAATTSAPADSTSSSSAATISAPAASSNHPPPRSASRSSILQPIVRVASASSDDQSRFTCRSLIASPQPLAVAYVSYTLRYLATGEEFVVSLPPILLSIYAPVPAASSLSTLPPTAPLNTGEIK